MGRVQKKQAIVFCVLVSILTLATFDYNRSVAPRKDPDVRPLLNRDKEVLADIGPNRIHPFLDSSDQQSGSSPVNVVAIQDLILNAVHLPSRCDAATVDVLFLVKSLPNAHETRDFIRSTWGLTAKQQGVQVVFVMGQSESSSLLANQNIAKESMTFGDIFQINFTDTYYNLTIKTLSMLHGVKLICPEVQCVGNIDADVVPFIENIVQLCADMVAKYKDGLVTGSCFHKLPVNRELGHKWYLSPSVFKPNIYPDFCSGTGHLLTAPAVTKLLEHATDMTQLRAFHLEDVLFTGVYREAAGVPAVHNAGFYHYKRRPGQLTCREIKSAMTMHHGVKEISEVKTIWRSWQNRIEQCAKRQLHII